MGQSPPKAVVLVDEVVEVMLHAHVLIDGLIEFGPEHACVFNGGPDLVEFCGESLDLHEESPLPAVVCLQLTDPAPQPEYF
jgi:hypothetical protein